MTKDKKEEIKELIHNFVDEMNQISYDISDFISKTQEKYHMNADKCYIFFEFLRKYGEFAKEDVSKDMKHERSEMDYVIKYIYESSEFKTTKEKND